MKNILPLLTPLLTLITDWLRPATKEQIREALVQYEAQVRDQDPWEAVKAPLRLVSNLIDRFLGDRLLSWQVFRRYTKYNAIVLVGSLLIIGFFTGTLFALRPTPWDAYSASVFFYETAVKVGTTNPKLKDNPGMPETVKLDKSIIRVMHHSWIKATYIVLFFVLVPLLAFILAYLVLALTRKLLRQMLIADPTTMVYVVLGYFIVMGVLLTFFIVIMGLYLVPGVWVAIPITIQLSMQSAYIALGVATVASVLSWVFIPGYIKAISILIFFPALVLLFLLVITVILYPFRRPIHYLIVQLCQRSIAHEKGPLVLLSGIIVVIITLVTLLTLS